jgi:hypothetical protein
MKMHKRGAAVWILVLLTLFCSVCGSAAGDGSAGASNETVQSDQYPHFRPDTSLREDGSSVIRSVLQSLTQRSLYLPDPPVLDTIDANATITPFPDRMPERMENETERDRSFGPIPALEITGAYVIFLLTFGLSALLLILLSRAGRRISAGYVLDCPRSVSIALAAGYLILGLTAGFLSIPVLSLFSASVLMGNQIWATGAAAFLLVYLLLASLLLSYAVFNRKSFVLVQAAHPIPAIALLVTLWIVTEPLSGVNSPVLLPGFMIASALLPGIHGYCMRRGIAPVPNASGSSSAPTMVSGGISAPVRTGNGFPPELDDRYMDAELVGRGGMALVFRAQRRTDGATVAVKVPTRYDEMTGHCFMKEMQIWKGLSHKNIVEVYAYNILPVPYVEMEYVGPSLADMNKPIPPDEAVRIIRGVAEGLACAHAAGLIHRDIKPGNILIAPDGTPRITDWGLGKEVADRKETRFIAFSLDYAAPEQISPGTYGRGDARTDIFQLGVVFYELLTGRLPFAGEGVGEVSVGILTAEPVPPSGIIDTLGAFDGIVLRCLEKKPDRRYQSIEDLLFDLDDVEDRSF